MRVFSGNGALLLALLVSLVLSTDRAESKDRSGAQAPKLKPGTRVEIDGVWRGQYLDATKLVVEEPDDLDEIKGHPAAIPPDRLAGKVCRANWCARDYSGRGDRRRSLRPAHPGPDWTVVHSNRRERQRLLFQAVERPPRWHGLRLF